MDICLRVHRTYDRMGTLGKDNIGFKTRMFLHMQYACQYRVVHANAVAMTVFEDATDPFVARLPGQSKSFAPKRSSAKQFMAPDAQTSQDSLQSTGCYLCSAVDHWASDRNYHPLVNGKHKPLSDETKKAIMKRIESSKKSHAMKNADKKRVRRYWSQHGL